MDMHIDPMDMQKCLWILNDIHDDLHADPEHYEHHESDEHHELHEHLSVCTIRSLFGLSRKVGVQLGCRAACALERWCTATPNFDDV